MCAKWRVSQLLTLAIASSLGLHASAQQNGQSGGTSTQVERGNSLNSPRTSTRPGRGSPLDRLTQPAPQRATPGPSAPRSLTPANATPARSLPATAPNPDTLSHLPPVYRERIQQERAFVERWNEVYAQRREIDSTREVIYLLPSGRMNVMGTFLGPQYPSPPANLGPGFGRSPYPDSLRYPVRPRTVNDIAFTYEYVLYRTGINLANPWSRTATCVDPTRGFDSALLEPVDLNTMFPTLNAQVAQSIQSPVPLTTLEAADAAFIAGNPAQAIEHYKTHLVTDSDDNGAKVRLAIAMLDAGEIADATALLHMVYATDPQLAAVSFREIVPNWNPSRLRASVRRTVEHANRTGSASAWMTVTLLMEAEGRTPLAQQMLKRASDAGLDSLIYAQIKGFIESASPSKG